MAIVEDVPDSTSNQIPLRRPSSAESPSKPLIEVGSSLRQRRHDAELSDTSPGQSEKVENVNDLSNRPSDVELDDGPEVFDIAIITMPFVFLYLLLDILVHLQYQHRPSINHVIMSLIKAIPTLSVIVYYTTKHSTHFLTTSLLMSTSIISGCRLIWLVNKAGWAMTTDQAPAMGTLWILTIVQLPLSRAIIALVVVAGWTRYAGMKVTP